MCRISTGWCDTPWAEELPEDVYQTLSHYGSNLRYSDFQKWRTSIVDPSGHLNRYLQATPDALSVRVTPGGKPVVQIPFLKGQLRNRPAHGELPLSGLRIMLDPGHFGGSWSKDEGGHFPPNATEPVVREGNLTWGVARILQEMLERSGADVWLTRSEPPQIAFKDMYDAGFQPAWEAALWLGMVLDEPKYAPLRKQYPSRRAVLEMEKAKKEFLEKGFPVYNSYYLRKRANLSETVNPHVTLSIHFNAAGKWNDTINNILVFMPGNLRGLGYGTHSERFYWIRHMMDGDPMLFALFARDISVSLQEAFDLQAFRGDEFSVTSDLELFEREDSRTRSRTNSGWLPVVPSEGVYATNFAVLRRAKGPVLLVEGPFYDNRQEFERLVRKDFQYQGRWYPNRVAEYSQALFESIHRNAALLRSRMTE